MYCYFIVQIFIGKNKDRSAYDEYIRAVKPIVESYGGEYLVRTEKIDSWSDEKPDRIIIVRFPSRASLDECFASEEYRAIKILRESTVKSVALIAEGL